MNKLDLNHQRRVWLQWFQLISVTLVLFGVNACTGEGSHGKHQFDFDGDGKADILLRNTATGQNVVWRGGHSNSQQGVAPADQKWKVVGVGDFDGDGKADILWRDSSSGAMVIWRGGNSAKTQSVSTTSLDWTAIFVM